MGFEDHPIFSFGQPWSMGVDISKTESPSLCALLYNEVNLLIKIAHILRETTPLASLEALAENLKRAVVSSWDEDACIYRNWDRESHYTTKGELLGELKGPGEIKINRTFNPSIRLVFKLLASDEHPRQVRLFIHGISGSGSHRIERIETDQFRWHLDQGNVTSESIYSELEWIEVVGIGSEDILLVSIMDLDILDQTLLLPLWAGIPDMERASKLIRNVITNPGMFWKPFGIPACLQEDFLGEHPCLRVDLIYNSLIGEGLLSYGYQKEAAALVSSLMQAVIGNLKNHNSFFRYYHAISGTGISERNTLGGLPPFGLFLETLGVRIISPTSLSLWGENPFPWPVTLCYRGLTIFREHKKTRITFPGGQTAVITSQEPRLITLDSDHE
jgi:hypothetical protein